jgi:hypothetical protein
MGIVGAALRGFGKALGKGAGKSTSKFVKRRLTVNGTPLNTKEKAIVGASGALATAGAGALGYGYKKAYDKLKEVKGRIKSEKK